LRLVVFVNYVLRHSTHILPVQNGSFDSKWPPNFNEALLLFLRRFFRFVFCIWFAFQIGTVNGRVYSHFSRRWRHQSKMAPQNGFSAFVTCIFRRRKVVGKIVKSGKIVFFIRPIRIFLKNFFFH
jgi:hypothetical protein